MFSEDSPYMSDRVLNAPLGINSNGAFKRIYYALSVKQNFSRQWFVLKDLSSTPTCENNFIKNF